ncbi:hypothetical protein RclHR1_11520005 [Rhizophagus clarus]|uniref:Uncharacterized protein n=1 Tax=Rhizophagus clarus TaxID=94130 RepID=A0A2Z6Q4M9_9GLOM|nr:hypothetical protein RclHR1_11520005 [Rhizophagus clarus]GES96506.1 hypothetical protein RCL_jg14533.t1 [Rhizophagus clarus]
MHKQCVTHPRISCYTGDKNGISSPVLHQSNPVAPNNIAESKSKSKGKKKNKNKNTLVVNPAFASSQDNILAQDATSSVLPLLSENTIINKATTSFTSLPESSGTKKKQRCRKWI